MVIETKQKSNSTPINLRTSEQPEEQREPTGVQYSAKSNVQIQYMEDLKKQMAQQKDKIKLEKELKSLPQEGMVFSGYADHKAKMDKLSTKKLDEQCSGDQPPQYQQQYEPQLEDEKEPVQQVPNLYRCIQVKINKRL